MPEPITLPPSTLHLGQQVKVRWIDGKTTTGILAGVDADAMHVVDGVADTRIPYSLIDVAVRVDQPTPAGDPADRYAGLITGAMDEIEGIGEHPAGAGDRTAEPMSDERLAEFRRRVEREHVVRMVGLGGPECSCGETVPCQERAAALALLAELERLRAELDKVRWAARRQGENAEASRAGWKQTEDALLAEVEQWRATFGESALRDGLARMARVEAERDAARAELAEERERNTRIVLAKRNAERACAQMADRIQAGREQAVKDVIRATDAEAERDEARAALAAVALVKTWTDEDGKAFVFVDDLTTALPVHAGPTALRHRMADAIVAHLHPPHEWPDGPPSPARSRPMAEDRPATLDDQGRAALTAAASGYTNESAARRWGVSRSWVGDALHRARSALAAQSTAHAVALALLDQQIDPAQVRDRVLPPWPRKYGREEASS